MTCVGRVRFSCVCPKYRSHMWRDSSLLAGNLPRKQMAPAFVAWGMGLAASTCARHCTYCAEGCGLAPFLCFEALHKHCSCRFLVEGLGVMCQARNLETQGVACSLVPCYAAVVYRGGMGAFWPDFFFLVAQEDFAAWTWGIFWCKGCIGIGCPVAYRLCGLPLVGRGHFVEESKGRGAVFVSVGAQHAHTSCTL